MLELDRKQKQSFEHRIIKTLDSLPDKPKKLFNDFEDDIIRKYYPLKGGQAVAKALNKTYNQIKTRACTLGVHR